MGAIVDLEADITLLRKYKEGRIVDKTDIDQLNRLANVGLIKKGLIIQSREITARSTEIGLKILSEL
jgi:hypothetical protein